MLNAESALLGYRVQEKLASVMLDSEFIIEISKK